MDLGGGLSPHQVLSPNKAVATLSLKFHSKQTVSPEEMRLLHEFSEIVGLFADRRQQDAQRLSVPERDNALASGMVARTLADGLTLVMPAFVSWDHTARGARGHWQLSFDQLRNVLARVSCLGILADTTGPFMNLAACLYA